MLWQQLNQADPLSSTSPQECHQGAPPPVVIEQLKPHQHQQRGGAHINSSSRAARRKLLQQLSRSGHVCSLLVMAQVLRLLLTLSGRDPSSAMPDHHLRSQLLKEIKAAAAAAHLDGDDQHELTAMALLKRLPAARLQQVMAAAKKKRPTAQAAAAPAAARPAKLPFSTANSDSSCSTDDSSPNMLHQHHHHHHQPSQALQQLQSHAAPPHTVDVGCLLETTLVAAAAEVQLNSFSLGGSSIASEALADDACSPVDIESVMQQEFELAQQSGLL